MAPLMKADPSTSAKMADIKRSIWSQAHGDISLIAELPKPTNGFPNKNPKANAEISLIEFKIDGEKTTQVYIADAWPMDHEVSIANVAERRIVQGQGPMIKKFVLVKKDGEQGVGLIDALSPTRKHWTRGERRARTRAQRRARRVMRGLAR